MKQDIFWTSSKARLKRLHINNRENYNWLFLPGGPGLGSESLRDLTDMLSLPGAMWAVDLPGDGSNLTENDSESFSKWSNGLIEAVNALDNVILVAHSSGGMFALATPELEKDLLGLVLMDSAPSADWQNIFSDYVKKHPIPETERLQQLYENNPSNALLKALTIVCAPYFSIKENREKVTLLLDSLPFNYKSHLWAEMHFDKTYQALWIPQTIPTLIFSGDNDHITPLTLFSQSKEFQRNNIMIREIKNASHFPWIDQPEVIQALFTAFLDQFSRDCRQINPY